MPLTTTEFLTLIAKVYDEESEYLLKAQSDPQKLNYVVGKIMVKSKGQISPELATKITAAIVASDLPNNHKFEMEEQITEEEKCL